MNSLNEIIDEFLYNTKPKAPSTESCLSPQLLHFQQD